MPADIPTLLTSRLCLRAPALDDYENACTLWGDPNVMRQVGAGVFGREAVWGRLLRYVGHWNLLGFGFWVVERRSDDAFVGWVGFGDFHRDIDPPLGPDPEIGWMLTPPMHGQGLATEAARAALDWRDVTLPQGPTCCIIGIDNIASRRLAEKLGFVAKGEATYQGTQICVLERNHPLGAMACE